MSRQPTVPPLTSWSEAVATAGVNTPEAARRVSAFLAATVPPSVDEPVEITLAGGGTDRTTLLYTAARSGHVATVTSLLNRGGDPNLRVGRAGNTPFLVACYRGRADVVQAMLTNSVRRADPAVQNSAGEGPLTIFADSVPAATISAITAMVTSAESPPQRVSHAGAAVQQPAPASLAAVSPGADVSSTAPSAAAHSNPPTAVLPTATAATSLGSGLGPTGQFQLLVDAALKAIASGALDAEARVRRLLRPGQPHVGQPDDFGPTMMVLNQGFPTTLLHFAAQCGNADMVTLLCREFGVGADGGADASLRLGMTPLILAITSESEGTVSALLDAGADANDPAWSRATLGAVQAIANPDVRRKITERVYNASKYKATLDGDQIEEALRLAETNDKSAVIKLSKLLVAFGDVNAPIALANGGYTTLLYSAARGGHVQTVTNLLNRGGDPNRRVSHLNSTPFLVACYRGRVEIVDAMMQSAGIAPDVSLVNDAGEGPLTCFAEDVDQSAIGQIFGLVHFPYEDLRKALLARDLQALEAFVDRFDVDHVVVPRGGGEPETALLIAIRDKVDDVAEYLLTRGAGPDGPREKSSPQATAFSRGHAFSVSQVLPRTTPLQVAWSVKSMAAAKMLVEFGADVNGMIESALSPEEQVFYRKARLNVAPEVLAMEAAAGVAGSDEGDLEQFIASCPTRINDAYDLGQTLLHLCSTRGNTRLVRHLVSKGADVNLRDANGDTPLHLAIKGDTNGSHVDAVRVLIQAGADTRCANAAGSTPAMLAQRDARLLQAFEAAVRDVEMAASQALFDSFVASLPDRFDAGWPVLRITAVAKITTEQSLRIALECHARDCAKALAESRAYGTKRNPVYGTWVAAAVEHAAKRVSGKLNSMQLNEILSLPLPQLLPVSATDALAFAELPALRDVHNLLSSAKHLHPSCWLALGAGGGAVLTKPADVDVATHCESIFAALTAALRAQALKELEDKGLGRYANAFVRDALLVAAIDEFTAVPSLVPPCSLVKGSAANNIVTTIASTVDASVFMAPHVAAWKSTEPQLHAQVLALLGAPKQGSGTDLAKVTQIDGLIAAHLGAAADGAAESLAKGFGPDECKWATIVSLRDRCAVRLRAAVAEALHRQRHDGLSVAGELVSAGAYPTVLSAERLVTEGVTVKSLLTELLDAAIQEAQHSIPLAGTTAAKSSATAGSLKRFVAIASRLKSAHSSGGAFATVGEAFEAVLRPLSLETQWHTMPAYEMMDRLTSALNNNVKVLLIEAQTGSGKSVLVPQHLSHENAGAIVICTQPRRLPVTSIASHVSNMFGRSMVGSEVGGSAPTNSNGRLQYKTDALALGQLLTTPPTSKPVLLIIDEVHERSPTMDFLFLTCLKHMTQGAPITIVLASATVDKAFFESTARTFGVKFEHLKLPGSTPHPITVEAHSPLLAWPAPASAKTARPSQGARDAADIMARNPGAKVLVFLPTRSEVEAAKAEFDTITSGKIASAALHAQAEDGSLKAARSTVIFANNIAETSLTIPGLTNVLDFNLAMQASIDDETNCRTLCIGMATVQAQVQRKGRVGRTQPGSYKHYYDLTQLAPSTPCGFDTLLPDNLLQFEMRARHFLKCSLWRGVSGLSTLGLGIDPAVRKPSLLERIPKSARNLEIAASLSLTASMADSFFYAVQSGKCANAVLWLATMLEARLTPTVTSWASKHVAKFGSNGDLGIMLDVYHDYAQSKARYGSTFKVDRWAATRGLRPLYFEAVDARLHQVDAILARLGLGPFADDYTSWTWADISDVLLAGLHRNTAALVKSNLRDYNYKATLHQLDSTQTTGIEIFRGSLFAGTVAQLPDFVAYTHLERYDAEGRRFAKELLEVDAVAVDKWTARDSGVLQSIGIIGSLKQRWDSLNKTYPAGLVKVEVNPAAFTVGLQARAGPKALPNIKCEFQVRGTRMAVARMMAEIAADLLTAQASNLSAPGLLPQVVQAFGKPPATLASLRSVAPNVARRLALATESRTASDISAALQSTDQSTVGLAVINMLLNCFGFIVKGGIVRDLVVCGQPQFKDIDCEAPAGVLTPSNWKSELAALTQQAARTFGAVTFSAPQDRPVFGTSTAAGIVTFYVNGSVEVEVVTPWNTAYVPCPNMDFSCNNLKLMPGSSDLGQSFTILMTTKDIVRQLVDPSGKQTSPCRDSTWQPGGTDGVGKNMTLKGTNAQQQARIVKMRSKGFHFCEAAYCSGSPLVLFHGTDSTAAQAIASSQRFKPSARGNFGPGVYLSRDLRIVRLFANPNILRVELDPGMVVMVGQNQSTDQSGTWQKAGVDSCIVPSDWSFRDLEEWVIRDPARITNITIVV